MPTSFATGRNTNSGPESCSIRVFEVLQTVPNGLITDVDGTISAITSSPQAATVTVACRDRLQMVAQRLSLLAVVSGRPALEVRRMVDVDPATYIGQHGLEWLAGGRLVRHPAVEAYRTKIAAALRTLQRKLDRVQGIELEDKVFSLAIHYRASQEPTLARQAVLAATEELSRTKSLMVVEGKKVIELRPPIPLDKGTAVMSLIRKHNLRGVVYLGDDATDIDAFCALRQWRQSGDGVALTVGVLGPDESEAVAEQADITLSNPDEVERLLGWLAERISLSEESPAGCSV